MRLAVVGDTRHFVDGDGRLCTLEGVASQLEQWATLFDELVLVVPLHPGPPPPGFRPYRCTNVVLRPLRPAGGDTLAARARLALRLPGWSWRVARVLGEVDGVHLRCPCNVGLVGIVVACLLRPRRHRYAMYAGNWHGYDGEPWSYRLQRRLLRHPRFGGLVTVYSDRPPAVGHVAPLFSPTFTLGDWEDESARVSDRRPGQSIRLVTVGHLTDNKRQADIVRAVRLLVDRGADVQLDVVGDGPRAADLQSLVQALDLEGRVHLCGRLDHDDVRRRYRQADVNVLASRTEGYPKVVVEGMVSGAVPVVSDFPMARAMVGDGERGLTFEGGDPVALADRISELRDSPGWVAAMVAAGRAYTRTVTLDAYRDAIEALLEKHWGVSLAVGDRVGHLGHRGRDRIRVMHVVDALRIGGMERMAVEIANLSDPAEVDVTVCASRSGGPLQAEVRPGIDVVVLGRRGTWDLRGLARFRRLVRSRRIDVVHSHGSGPARMVALCRALRLVPARHLFHDHAGAPDLATRPRLTRQAIRRGVDAYVGVNAAHRQWAVTALGLSPDRVSVVVNGVDLTRFDPLPPPIRPQLGLAPDDVVLVMVAGFRPQKDHPTILRALTRLRHPEKVRLVLVGTRFDGYADYYDRCRSMIDDLGLAGRVLVLGDSADVPAVLASADAGVLCSPHESGPLVLAEYMAAGLPYVVTDTGEVTRAVKGTGTGWVVPTGDPDALAAAIDELVATPAAARAAMGERGRQVARDQFDQRRVASSIADVYRRLGRGSSPSRRLVSRQGSRRWRSSPSRSGRR